MCIEGSGHEQSGAFLPVEYFALFWSVAKDCNLFVDEKCRVEDPGGQRVYPMAAGFAAVPETSFTDYTLEMKVVGQCEGGGGYAFEGNYIYCTY